MNLHLVGGFLGSGKTTAIIQAAKILMGRGQRVGVITNDQGKYLVDTAFVRLADLPAVEVAGGCFCCHYDDLNERLDQLIAQVQPQVIFAESVGSCADIVATVIKPLVNLTRGSVVPASFSVFADSRLLLRRLRGQEMPFSDDVVYIFDQQIEEAGLLVANKADLPLPQDLIDIESRVAQRYPGKPYLLQSSLTPEGVWTWVNLIQSGGVKLPQQSLLIDYKRYAAGEAGLAWLDQQVQLEVPDGTGKAVVESFIRRLLVELAGRGAEIGHIKLLIKAGEEQAKLSVPSLPEPGWEAQIPVLRGCQISLLVNARVETSVEELVGLLRDALQLPCVRADFQAGEAFHPTEPKPTHRIL